MTTVRFAEVEKEESADVLPEPEDYSVMATTILRVKRFRSKSMENIHNIVKPLQLTQFQAQSQKQESGSLYMYMRG